MDPIAQPSEPILTPKLRIHFADFPYQVGFQGQTRTTPLSSSWSWSWSSLSSLPTVDVELDEVGDNVDDDDDDHAEDDGVAVDDKLTALIRLTIVEDSCIGRGVSSDVATES